MNEPRGSLPSVPDEKGNDSPEGKPSLEFLELFKPVVVNKYPAINIRIDKFSNQLQYIHKLVAELFLPTPAENQKFVIHKDYNPTNNNVKNLAWATAAERGSHQKKILYL